jgi:hypothetical protein
MAYNVKITEYANGQLEVTTYKQGVYTMLDGESSYRADMIDKNADALAWRFASYVIDEKTGQGRFIPRIEDREYCYNPFTEKIQRVYTDYDELAIERKKEHSLYSSLNRTRSALYMYARQCNWEYFITLTYSPDKIESRYDFSLCMKKAHKWIDNCKQRKAKDLLYLLVPEQHKDGAWHIHGLLCNTTGLTFTDSGKRFDGKIVYNLDDWKLGFSTATKVTDTYKVSNYITKYITKDLCAITPGKQRYFVSKSIPKPKTFTALMDPDEVDSFIQEVADSYGADLEYQKDVSGYLDVNYKYFKKCQTEREDKKNGKQ